MDRLAARGRLTHFVERHQLIWEGVMAFLALAYFILALRHDDDPSSLPVWVLFGFGTVFLLEFVARFADAPSRRAYLRTHWLDLIAAVPYVGALSALRLLRLFRLVSAIRRILQIEPVSKEGGHHSLWFLWPIVLLLWAGSAYGMWVFEHEKNQHLRTFSGAIYWAVITTTTIGYGDVAPVTQEGRVLSGLLALTGIGLVGVLSSQVTTWILRERDDLTEVTDELRAIRAELTELRVRLQDAHHHAENDQNRSST